MTALATFIATLVLLEAALGAPVDSTAHTLLKRDHHTSTGEIVGYVIALIVILLIIGTLVWLCNRRVERIRDAAAAEPKTKKVYNR
ncbi:uncharacterized protein LOC62_01G001042 [Vanrija pseudolonga]|uniref:Uncharacterized protein n=1 Tax=Vanrija pseudolonga TaxID=143232 RepID=A0AAF0Y051_9TREE|nr:hypothetical protein LOC62_01G001042 [Vanrija pseudolonga]